MSGLSVILLKTTVRIWNRSGDGQGASQGRQRKGDPLHVHFFGFFFFVNEALQVYLGGSRG